MSVSSSSSSPTHLIPIDPRIYCETMNELHSYITSSKRGYLTQAELFRYYRQRHDSVEIPYRLLGYRSLLDLLSSDQRLFTIDLRREPAYVYSAVKLRQQNREQRQGNTSFTRQHHSTNTLDEQHIASPDYVFFDHHVPLNEQEQNIKSIDEQESQNERPLTPNNHHHHYDTNVWHTPQLDEQINSEESNVQTIQFGSNPFLPLPTIRPPLEINETLSIPHENQLKTIHRRIISQDNENKSSSVHLNRSISTSTTSLSKTYSFHIIDLYLFIFTIVICFGFFGLYLYKIC